MPSITTPIRPWNRNEFLVCEHTHKPDDYDGCLVNGQPWCWECVNKLLESADKQGITLEVVRRQRLRRSL